MKKCNVKHEWPSFAQKIDFNLVGHQPKQVTANGFMPWVIQRSQKESKVIDAEKNVILNIESVQREKDVHHAPH